MSKLAAENIWWPDCTQNHTEVVEGCNEHLSLTNGARSSDHHYSLRQTAEKIMWVCVCGRTLTRLKYPREER
jgi:hypothetical protein